MIILLVIILQVLVSFHLWIVQHVYYSCHCILSIEGVEYVKQWACDLISSFLCVEASVLHVNVACV